MTIGRYTFILHINSDVIINDFLETQPDNAYKWLREVLTSPDCISNRNYKVYTLFNGKHVHAGDQYCDMISILDRAINNVRR